MDRPLALTFACLALIATGPGCTARAPDAEIGADGGGSEGVLSAIGISDQRIALRTNGVVDIDLETFGGKVSIVGDEGTDTAFVELERGGAFAWGRGEEEKASLGDIRYTVSLDREAEGRDLIVVRAVTDHPEAYYQNCSVRIVVPQLGQVRVRNGRGPVTVIHNRGNVDIVTSRGRVRMMTPWKIVGPLAITTDEGDIDVRVRAESEGLIDAETRIGRVRSHAPYGDFRLLDTKNDLDTIVASLNHGTNVWTLRNAGADIDFSVVPKPVVQSPFAIHP